MSLPHSPRPDPRWRHHGDREVGEGLVDLAVNVHQAPLPDWLARALRGSLDDLARYPDPAPAEAALAGLHGRDPGEVLATSGAAEAFTLLARLHPWRRPVVVHPQFTEPDVTLAAAGCSADHLVLEGDFRLDRERASLVPADADLVIVGNPTNPTGLRHAQAALLALTRPGRLVIVDEAFNDDGAESLAARPVPGLVVVRSLTKLWAIAGLRAGHLLAEPDVVASLRDLQPPWSVSTPAAAAMVACTTPEAVDEAARRVRDTARWRAHLQQGLADLGVPHLPSSAPFVLLRPGAGVHAALRASGVAVRRCNTFPGLGEEWIRVAVREPAVTDLLLSRLARVIRLGSAPQWHSDVRVP